MNALSEKEEKLDTKEPKGIGRFFETLSFFCLQHSILPGAKQKTKVTCLDHPKDHRRLFDSIVKPLDPHERKMGY